VRVEHSDEQTQCFDVMQQMLSVIGLLKNANHHILEQYLTEYVRSINSKNISKSALQKIQKELLHIVQKAQNN